MFWDKVLIMPGCWFWQGYIQKTGYGYFSYKGRDWQAHRLAVFFTGDDIKGKAVCHTCDVKHCVNPYHLWIGTQAENMKDMFAKGRGIVGEKSHFAKLTERDVIEIRRKYKKGVVRYIDLANEFGVSGATILRVVRRLKWRHVK